MNGLIIASTKKTNLTDAIIEDLDKMRAFVNNKPEHLKLAYETSEKVRAIYFDKDEPEYATVLSSHVEFEADAYIATDVKQDLEMIPHVKTPTTGYMSAEAVFASKTPVRKAEAKPPKKVEVAPAVLTDKERIALKVKALKAKEEVKEKEAEEEEVIYTNQDLEYFAKTVDYPELYTKVDPVGKGTYKLAFDFYSILAMALAGGSYKEFFNKKRETHVVLKKEGKAYFIFQISSFTSAKKVLSYSLMFEKRKDGEVFYHAYVNKRNCSGWKSFSKTDLDVYMQLHFMKSE